MTASDIKSERFMTVGEVADIMRLSKMSVYRLIHSGDLDALRIGRSYRVRESAVRQYLADAEVQGATE